MQHVPWHQRLENYEKALEQLLSAVRLAKQRELSELEKQGLITNGQEWMEMIASRNKTSHTYNKSVSEEITQKIINSYSAEFVALRLKMNELKSK